MLEGLSLSQDPNLQLSRSLHSKLHLSWSLRGLKLGVDDIIPNSLNENLRKYLQTDTPEKKKKRPAEKKSSMKKNLIEKEKKNNFSWKSNFDFKKKLKRLKRSSLLLPQTKKQ